MTNLVFIHGVDSQSTGYSNLLFKNILKAYKKQLLIKGLKNSVALEKTGLMMQHEILWANRTTNLTSRYLSLQYNIPRRKGKWNFLYKAIDPLAIQTLFYTKDKGHKTGPMSILRTVHQSFKKSCGNKPEKTIVIAHSLGSVIAFDYLFGFRRYKLSKQVNIAGLFTLGSPIPLFASAMGYAENPVTMPPNLAHWINILDPDDGVARHCRLHFKRLFVEDKEINTGWDPLGSHTSYWKSSAVAEFIAQRMIRWNI
ncbi:hypothetical protein K8S19_06460 [bacterium]|nr:hypothetical protein [bacterium]